MWWAVTVTLIIPPKPGDSHCPIALLLVSHVVGSDGHLITPAGLRESKPIPTVVLILCETIYTIIGEFYV